MRPLPIEKDSSLEELWKRNQEKAKKQNEGKEGKEQIELTFQGGQFGINRLTQYTKEPTKPYIFPFINLLFEDSHKDMKLDPPQKTLQSALMTTYGFEEDLLKSIAKSNVNLVIVNDGGKEIKDAVILKNHFDYSNWTVILPAKQNVGQYQGAFHPKIWILKFPHFIRILIGSPNLHIADWTMWSQAFWIQDFPKGKPVFKLDEKSQEFKDIVISFMGQILPKEHNCQRLLQIDFEDYDFSGVKIRLVQSIPGRISQDDLKLYGLGRLSDIISKQLKANNLKPIDKMVITYQTTSIGMIDEKYIQYLKQAFRGETLHEIKNDDKYKKIDKMFGKIQIQKDDKKQVEKDEKKQVEKDEKEQVEKDEQEESTVELKLVYPSLEYIMNQSQGGVDWAHPLFMKYEHYEKSKIIRQSLHQFQGSDNYFCNTGLIPHLKTIIVTRPDMVIDDSSIIYFGSHNFSYSAWGRVEKNATQLSIGNTELGILLPPELGSKKDKEDIVLNKLPFKFPPNKYNEGELPWIKETYEQNQLKLLKNIR